jgi:hypothetical protein
MNKHLPAWAYGVLLMCGAVLIGSMFANWTIVSCNASSVTGFGMAWELKRLFVFPVAGALLVVLAVKRSEHARLAAIVAGTLIAGVAFSFAEIVLIDGGLDTWLILGGAGVSLMRGSSRWRERRLLGGVAVLLGFFAPWDDFSLWDGLTRLPGHAVGVLGLRILWLVPVGAICSILSALSARPRGLVGILGGVLVLGSMGYLVCSLLSKIFSGAGWWALGANAIILLIGVLAPNASTPATAVTSRS